MITMSFHCLLKTWDSQPVGHLKQKKNSQLLQRNDIPSIILQSHNSLVFGIRVHTTTISNIKLISDNLKYFYSQVQPCLAALPEANSDYLASQDYFAQSCSAFH